MPTTHRVQQGECLTSIAEQYGFYWQTLWNAPENARLRDLGRHPNVLHPGDEVVIPDKRMTSYMRPTGARHTWKVKGIPAKLRLRLLWDDEPRQNEPFVLTLDGGTVIRGNTDGDGRIDVTIPPDAMRATLRVGTGERVEEFSLNLGHLDPIEQESGVRARLENLGFGDTGVLSDAVRSFQRSQGMEPTGELDAVTRSRILGHHDPH